MSLNTEVYLHWARTPNSLRFIRALRAPEGLKPGPLCLPDRETLGWTLRSDGSVSRVFYVRVDIARDCLGPFEPDHDYPTATAGSTNVKLKQSLLPINDDDVPEIVMLDEEMQRAPVRKHWVAWHNARAEERRLEKQRANEEAAAKVLADQAAKAELAAATIFVARPKPKPKTWFDILRGRQ